MYCKYCGGEIKDGALKCKHCKKWIEEKSSQSSQNTNYSTKFILNGLLGITILLCLGGLLAFLLSNFSNNANNLALQYNVKNKTYSYVTPNGKTVIQLGKDVTLAYEFSEGLAVVVTNGKYGAIDRTGAFVINPVYDNLWRTTEGLTAYITVKKEDSDGYKNEVKLGYLDKNGNIAIEPKSYESDYCPEMFLYNPEFSKGLAVAYDKKSGKYGYIDKTGSFIIEPQFSSAESFVGNLAAVSIGDNDGTNRKYGYIDRMGKLIIEPQFDFAENFTEGLALIGLSSNNEEAIKYGYINMKGKVVIPTKYEKAYSFSDGLAAVYSNNNWGYIDSTGKYVTKPIYKGIPFGWDTYDRTFTDEDYNFAFKFINGVAPVCTEWTDEKSTFVLIDKSGKVISPEFDSIERRTGNTYVVYYYTGAGANNNKEGSIDSNGKWIVPIKNVAKKRIKTKKQLIGSNIVSNVTKIKQHTVKVKNNSKTKNDLKKAEQDLLN